MDIICRKLTNEEFDQALAVRMQVFVDEQQVPIEEEHDEHDATAEHFGVFYAKQLVGTGRLLLESTAEGALQARVGRMAVLPAYRKQGVGRRLIEGILEQAQKKGAAFAVLNAQVSALEFYRKQGFAPHGPVFMEAGIPHRAMTLALAPAQIGRE